MARFEFRNPFAFTPWPVTLLSSTVYVVILVAVILVHVTVPPAPDHVVDGVNVTEAWADLQELTNGYHPYNSKRNDLVRDWLLQKIEWILERNGIPHSLEDLQNSIDRPGERDLGHERQSSSLTSTAVTVFNDMQSNVSFSSAQVTSGRKHEPGQSIYFEGTNIIVYIRGSQDDDTQWWNGKHGRPAKGTKGGVLVNSHYDSVSTGFGATDDGVGVVSMLQLINHFTQPGKTPDKGIVLLFNNGEEDYLNGARAYTQHPISYFPHAFLNLEGAGAGGRATLFRSTDTEVTRYYRKSPHPFGSVLSRDGFQRGLIRSQTDYVIFHNILGLRGLDVAFMEPRQRYHTSQDDTRHTSKASVWHMLSASLATIEGLSSDTGNTFEGPSKGKHRNNGKVSAGTGSNGVWFDMFGSGFAVFELRTLFALSLTLLIATPLTLALTVHLLRRTDKMYLFSRKFRKAQEGEEAFVSLNGWRGVFRFPAAVIIASAATMTLAFLLAKVNPFIVYSSEWAVWSMLIGAWFIIAWFLLSGADFTRPSALYRAYSLLWIYVLGWIAMVAVTVSVDRFDIAGGYFFMFYFASSFLAVLVSLLELFSLPTKEEYANQPDYSSSRRRSNSQHSRILIGSSSGPNGMEAPPEDEATETTPLVIGTRTSFARYRTPDNESVVDTEDSRTKGKAYGEEQEWSAGLPSWTWLLQLLLLAPVNLILVGQIGLLFVSAVHQTSADGSPVLTSYVAMAFFTILILLPLTPFLHRFTHHLVTFLLLVTVGTLIYNSLAFPFSSSSRLKVYFIQTVDLESGINVVSLTGVESYVRQIVETIPSAAGQTIDCSSDSRGKAGLTKCEWSGIPPNVVATIPPGVPPSLGYGDWLHYNASRINGTNEATLRLFGRNSRACKLLFDTPISDFEVKGAGNDSRFPRVPDEGSKELRLWSREWERPWEVSVKWEPEEPGQGLEGRFVCLWSDNNELGVIPALDEVRRFMPDWVGVSKLADGLVEGSKRFMV